MPDILLIQPPVQDFYLTVKRTIPYGPACLAASLIRSGFSVAILDALATSKVRDLKMPSGMDYLHPFYKKADLSPFALFHRFRHFGYSFEHIGNHARQSGAFLVGISSLFTAYSAEALETARVVKKFHPDCRIVMGGHHPTNLPEAVMECKSVDFLIRGEGEAALPLLAESLKKGRSLKDIPGIVFRKNSGLHISPPTFMENPDDFPLPALHLIRQHYYRRKGRGSAVIVSSRGCPMKCSYCAVGASSALRYRRRFVISVLREIGQAVKEHDAGFIDFEDENLTLHKEWFLGLLKGIREEFGASALELRAMNGLFPPSLDEEVICAMKQSGFRTLNLSLGSLSAEQLRRFRRPDVRPALENAIVLAEKYGLETVCYIIVGAPGQNAEDSVRDLLYLFQKNVLAGISVWYPAPGSEDYEKARQQGLLPDSYARMRSSTLPLARARSDAVTLLRLGRIANFMKALRDRGENIPSPAPCPPEMHMKMFSRHETGRELLRFFLYDGKIRGISREGEIYEHQTAPKLSQIFLSGLGLSQCRK